MKHEDGRRRSFLKQLVVASAVVAGSTLPGKKLQAKETRPGNRPDEVLYKRTDAFRKYYDSLR